MLKIYLFLGVFSLAHGDLSVFNLGKKQDFLTHPQFLASDQVQNILEGSTLHLVCRIVNLSMHHTVSWISLSNMEVLTVGGFVFSSDPRVSVSMETGEWQTSGTWTLRINPVKMSDEGLYQCQVNTEPASVMEVSVHIYKVEKQKPTDSKESQITKVLTGGIGKTEVTTHDTVVDYPDSDTSHHSNREQEGDMEEEFVDRPREPVLQEIVVEDANKEKNLPDQDSQLLLSSSDPEDELTENSSETVSNSTALLVPILSLCTAISLIVTLGLIRTVCARNKPDERPGGRSRSGTLESRRSNRSIESRRSNRSVESGRSARSGRSGRSRRGHKFASEEDTSETEFYQIRESQNPNMENPEVPYVLRNSKKSGSRRKQKSARSSDSEYCSEYSEFSDNSIRTDSSDKERFASVGRKKQQHSSSISPTRASISTWPEGVECELPRRGVKSSGQGATQAQHFQNEYDGEEFCNARDTYVLPELRNKSYDRRMVGLEREPPHFNPYE